MAKAKLKAVKENLYNAKALVYIKYDKENYKPGATFEVRESDVEELKGNGYATVDETSINVQVEPDEEPGEDGATDQEKVGE